LVLTWYDEFSQLHSDRDKQTLIPVIISTLHKNQIDLFTDSSYYTIKHNNALNEDFRIELWSKGVDQPRRPKNLSVQIVAVVN
jgi:hypothetical protein